MSTRGNRVAHHGAILGDPATQAGALAAFHDAFAVAASIDLLGLGAAMLVSDRLAATTMGAAAPAAGAGGREPAAVPV